MRIRKTKYTIGATFLENIKFQNYGEVYDRSEKYTDLIDVYVRNTKRNCILKFILKILFFVVTMGTLVTITVFFGISLHDAITLMENMEDLNEISLEAIVGIATAIIPAIVSLVIAFIKLPEIIAKYLFSIQEENSMNSIIRNIQTYDKDMYSMTQKVLLALQQHGEKDNEVKDDKIGKSPKKNDKKSKEAK